MNAQIFKENFLILRLWWRKMRGLALNELAPLLMNAHVKESVASWTAHGVLALQTAQPQAALAIAALAEDVGLWNTVTGVGQIVNKTAKFLVFLPPFVNVS